METSKFPPYIQPVETSSASTTPDKWDSVSKIGGPGGGGTVDSNVKSYIDAKTEATRAQNDARFANVLARLDNLASVSDIQDTKKDIQSAKWNVWGASLAVAGLVLAVLAFGGDRFDGGVQISSVMVEQAEEAKRLAAENTEKVDDLSAKLDALISIIRDDKSN